MDCRVLYKNFTILLERITIMPNNGPVVWIYDCMLSEDSGAPAFPWFFCSFCGEPIDVMRDFHVVHTRDPSQSTTIKIGNYELNTTIIGYECERCYWRNKEREMTAYEQLRIPI
jgi:hypothetical protein